MLFLIGVLCFILLLVGGRIVLSGVTKYLNMKARVEIAESAQRDMDQSLQTLLEEFAKIRAQSQKKANSSTATPNVNTSVKERLRLAVELTAQQNKIDRKKGPEFTMQHNELELEKLSVLKSIVADGFDTVITIRFSTGDEDVLLSNYIQSITRGLA